MALLKTPHFAELAAAVVQSLPCDLDPTIAQGWIENRKALMEVLRNALCPGVYMQVFPIWKTIQLGTGKDVHRLVTEWGSHEINLVKLTVADLGFKGGATMLSVYVRAQDLGLKLCPQEAGPYIRRQCVGLTSEEVLWVAMETIVDSSGNPNNLSALCNADGPWTDSDHYNPHSHCDENSVFVFCK